MFKNQQHIFGIWRHLNKNIVFEVCSNSMAPVIKSGDSIRLHMSDTVRYKPGDIVAFLRGDDVVVHRIVKKRRLKGIVHFCEKGDNTGSWSWISEKAIIGCVVSISVKNSNISMRQLFLFNKIMLFFGWSLVTLHDALSPVQFNIYHQLKDHFSARLKIRIVNNNKRFISSFLGALLPKT